MVALCVVAVVLTFLTVDFFDQRWVIWRAARRVASLPGKTVHLPFPEAHVPQGRFLAAGHTWIAFEGGDDRVLVGADTLAAHALGEIDRVELRPAGSSVQRGEVIAAIERAGRRIELRSAVSGVIEAVNENPGRNPDTLRRDPFGDGWLYRMKVRGLAQHLKDMYIGEDAAAFLSRELGRLGDAIAGATGTHAVGATLADGGIVASGAAVAVEDAAFQQISRALFDPRPAPAAAKGGAR